MHRNVTFLNVNKETTFLHLKMMNISFSPFYQWYQNLNHIFMIHQYDTIPQFLFVSELRFSEGIPLAKAAKILTTTLSLLSQPKSYIRSCHNHHYRHHHHFHLSAFRLYQGVQRLNCLWFVFSSVPAFIFWSELKQLYSSLLTFYRLPLILPILVLWGRHVWCGGQSYWLSS